MQVNGPHFMRLAKNKIMVCMLCPKSCSLSVADNFNGVSIENNGCNKGIQFAKKELADPERILTSTMKVDHGVLPLVSVRGDNPVKKDELKALIKQLDGMTLYAPVLSGQIVASDFGRNSVNIIATRTIDRLN